MILKDSENKLFMKKFILGSINDDKVLFFVNCVFNNLYTIKGKFDFTYSLT